MAMSEEKIKELTEKLKSRLLNSKFQQALQYLNPGIGEDDTETIQALARSFENTGWINGDMGQIVDTAVAYVLYSIDHPGWQAEQEEVNN